MIFQLQDDHSHLAIASHIASGETAGAAVEVFTKGTALYGTPQRLLPDNGAALNPTRRGRQGKLVEHVADLGVEVVTGKPYRPTTQGKNQRFHQTLLRWLDKQPIAERLKGLQALVDEFDVIYNEQCPHQGLPGRITPAKPGTRPTRLHLPGPRSPPALLSSSSRLPRDPSGLRSASDRSSPEKGCGP